MTWAAYNLNLVPSAFPSFVVAVGKSTGNEVAYNLCITIRDRSFITSTGLGGGDGIFFWGGVGYNFKTSPFWGGARFSLIRNVRWVTFYGTVTAV